MLLSDQAPQVQKKTILAATQVYKQTLMGLASAKHVTEDMEHAWKSICEVKQKVVFMVDNDNDGYVTKIKSAAISGISSNLNLHNLT